MRKYLPFFFFICLLVAMHYSQSISLVSQEVFATFSLSLLPALAPTMLLDYLFIHADGLFYLYQWIEKHAKKWCFSLYSYLILILGLLSGTPTLASYIEDSIQKGTFTKGEGEHMLGCFMLPSLPFLCGVILPCWGKKYQFLLLFFLYGPAIILFLFHKKKKVLDRTIDLSSHYEKNIIEKAITSTAKTLLLLLGSILLFSIPVAFFKMVFPDDISYALLGFFEFTSFSLYMSSNPSTLSFALLTTLLTFSSLSVYAQVSLLCPSVSIKKVMRKRFGLTLITILGLLLLFFLHVL